MGIYRTYFDKNNTIVKNSDVNTGRNQVSELYFGSSKSRFLFYCSFDEIKALVNSKVINIDGDTRHILKIKNTSNFDIKDFLSTSNNLLFGENYRPTSFDLELHEIKQFWDEGTGYDFMPSPTSIPENKDYALEPSNWVKATNTSNFTLPGAISNGSVPIATQHLDWGNEDIEMDITDFVKDEILSWNKKAVLVKDTPGFIVNRVARHFYLESLKCLEERVADFATIDALMENSGFKMGPFKLQDLIGMDINFSVTSSMFDSFHGESRFRPSRLQEMKVEGGFLGKKTGKGWYSYE